MGVRGQPGIYVEILIQAPLDRVWELTQQPKLHQRWDLRFSGITYLPKADPNNLSEPQRFLYETRIGAGLAIRGTGESVATRLAADGSATSSLQFASGDRLSLIREGAGYWRYVPVPGGVRFFTWYDYRVRFGLLGRVMDRCFRPLMGWATAWSFDRLRLWCEEDMRPEVTLRLAAVHTLARLTLAAVWLWHGLVPKLLFHDADERHILVQGGLSVSWLPWVGAAELAMALLLLVTWRWRGMFLVQVAIMAAALLAVGLRSPGYLTHAFNPVTLNLLVAALAITGYLASADLPSSGRCLRDDPRRLDPRQKQKDL